MTFENIIIEEAHRFSSFYGHTPKMIFLGRNQAEELDEILAAAMRFGVWKGVLLESVRPVYLGMAIYRVDADSHLSFGLEQPSPCG